MIRHRGPPLQIWQTFLRNHADTIAAIDLCVVPTLTFECLFAVTRHPDGGVVGAEDRGGISVGRGTDLFGARQRRAGLHKSNLGDGNSAPPDITEIAMAESIC